MHRNRAVRDVTIHNMLIRPTNRFRMLPVRFWAESILVMLLIKCVTVDSLPRLSRMLSKPGVALPEILWAQH